MTDVKNPQSPSDLVPDFTVTGFAAREGMTAAHDRMAAAHAQLKDVRALKLSICVGAGYNPSTNQICFNIPIYGDLCVTAPVPIPVGADLKVCCETCGSIIPTGLKVTVYLNGSAIFSGTVVGFC
jgi:hypothetical protein